MSPSYPTIFQLAYCLKTSVQLEELRTFEKCQLKAHQTVTQIHKLSPFEEVSSTGDCVITFSYMQQTTVALPSGRGVLNQRCWGTALNTRGWHRTRQWTQKTTGRSGYRPPAAALPSSNTPGIYCPAPHTCTVLQGFFCLKHIKTSHLGHFFWLHSCGNLGCLKKLILKTLRKFFTCSSALRLIWFQAPDEFTQELKNWGILQNEHSPLHCVLQRELQPDSSCAASMETRVKPSETAGQSVYNPSTGKENEPDPCGLLSTG